MLRLLSLCAFSHQGTMVEGDMVGRCYCVVLTGFPSHPGGAYRRRLRAGQTRRTDVKLGGQAPSVSPTSARRAEHPEELLQSLEHINGNAMGNRVGVAEDFEGVANHLGYVVDPAGQFTDHLVIAEPT